MTTPDVLERAAWLVRSQQERVKLQEELQKVFQLDWNDEALVGAPDWVKPVKDPQPFNSMQWLVDVLASDPPSYSIEIPEEAMPQALPPMQMGGGMDIQGMMQAQGAPPPEQTSAADFADMLERAVKEVFKQNDLRSATSLQRDDLYAAFVNGMVVEKIADLRLSGGKWDKFIQRNRGSSPFYIKSVNPPHVYFEYDEYGLCEVFHRYLRPLREVKRIYGDKVGGVNNLKVEDASGFALFCEYWTEETTAKWVEQVYYTGDADEHYFAGNQVVGAAYMLQEPTANPLEFIPYSIKVARGSSIFSRTNMVYPHLYAGHKSKLFLRQNLFLTVASTLAFMLVNPQMVQETDDPNNALQLDFSRPAVHGIRKGDKLTPIQMNMTRDFYDVMTMLGQKVEESTVSKVVAGQSPGGVTAASGINLLIGGGKLTVSGVQAAMGEVRSGSVQKIFNYVRMYPQFEGVSNANLELYVNNAFSQIDPASFPERMDIDVKYQAFLPQDKALAMQTFLQPVLQGLLSSDFLYGQIGVQDVVTLRKQIDADKTRTLADKQFEQQALTPPPDQSQDPNAQGAAGAALGGDNPNSQAQADQAAVAPDGSLENQQVDGAAPNPMVPQANPANSLNALFNSIQNPMSSGNG